MQPYELDEDYMSPEEWRESIALFKPGEWSSEHYQDVLQAMRNRARDAREEVTLPAKRSARERPPRAPLAPIEPIELRVLRASEPPLFSPAEYVFGAAAILGAFFVARWAARRYRAHHQAPAQPRALVGLDVVIGAGA